MEAKQKERLLYEMGAAISLRVNGVQQIIYDSEEILSSFLIEMYDGTIFKLTAVGKE